MARITDANRYIIPLIIVVMEYNHIIYNLLVSKYLSPATIFLSTEATLILIEIS